MSLELPPTFSTHLSLLRISLHRSGYEIITRCFDLTPAILNWCFKNNIHAHDNIKVADKSRILAEEFHDLRNRNLIGSLIAPFPE